MKDDVWLEEEQKQMVLLALAKLSLERPGFLDAIEELALKMDNRTADGKPEMLYEFRSIHAGSQGAAPLLRKCLLILVPALRASLELQSHYASLLNMHDGGERQGFTHEVHWVRRLCEAGVIPGTDVEEFFALLRKEY